MSRGRSKIHDQTAQTMAEYVVILGAITLVIAATVPFLSGSINRAFTRTVEIVRVAG